MMKRYKQRKGNLVEASNAHFLKVEVRTKGNWGGLGGPANLDGRVLSLGEDKGGLGLENTSLS